MLVRIGRRRRASRGGFGRPQVAPWSASSALTHRCGFGASAEPAEPSCAYDVLRVAPSATPAEINGVPPSRADSAGRRATERGGPTHDVFVKAVAAYEILSCERRRALYDAERRWTWDAAKNKNAASRKIKAGADPGARAPWAFILRHSEVLRDYGASVDALVPRGALRREIYAALGDALAGPELDVEAVASGDAFPKFFEAEERGAGLAANLGVDLMHVVSGRTLLAAVRERAGRSAIRGRGDEEGRHRNRRLCSSRRRAKDETRRRFAARPRRRPGRRPRGVRARARLVWTMWTMWTHGPHSPPVCLAGTPRRGPGADPLRARRRDRRARERGGGWWCTTRARRRSVSL